MAQSSAKWARWAWAHGKGRAHRLFADGDLTKTACQSPRKSSKHSAVVTGATAAAVGGTVCPTCQLFDSLHDKLVATTDAIATTKVPTFSLADILTAAPVTAQAAPQPTDGRPVAPQGICTCGCDQSDDARAYRTALAEWQTAEHSRKEAEFDAYLKGTVAA